MRERYVEQVLAKKVKKAGGLCWKLVSPGMAGVPDRLVILNGQVCFVELKRPHGGRVSELQKVRMKELEAAGARVLVIRDPQEVDDFVAGCLQSAPVSA